MIRTKSNQGIQSEFKASQLLARVYCMQIFTCFSSKNHPNNAADSEPTNPDEHLQGCHAMPCLPPAPRCKDAMEHLGHEVPLRRLQEHVEVVVHLVHLPEVHQEPQAAALEPRQPVQVRGLEPLQHVASVDVLQQALVAGLLQVSHVVLVGRPEERQPVREELLAAQVAVDVVEEGVARLQGHVGDVHSGELLLPEVVREHAPEDGGTPRQDGAVGTHAADCGVDRDVGEDVLVQHPRQGRQSDVV